MTIRTSVLVGSALVGSLGWCAGCLTGLERNPRAQVRTCTWAIVNGEGHKKPRGSDRDYFALLMDLLDHPDPDVQFSAASSVSNSTVASGCCYGNVLDGYIEAGRDEELHRRLREAWQRSKVGDSDTVRSIMASALADLRMRQYLWAHPEVAEETALDRNEPPQRGWYHLMSVDKVYISRRLLAAGDEEFREVWEDGDARLYEDWTEETLQAALRQSHAIRELERSRGWTKATGPSSRPDKR